MTAYRMYCQHRDGHISFAEWIEADSDGEALAIARSITKGAQKCEVWEQRRLVGTLGSSVIGQAAHALTLEPTPGSAAS